MSSSPIQSILVEVSKIAAALVGLTTQLASLADSTPPFAVPIYAEPVSASSPVQTAAATKSPRGKHRGGATRKYTDAQLAKSLELRNATQMTWQEIGDVTGVNYRTLSAFASRAKGRVIEKQEPNGIRPKRRGGRPRKYSDEQYAEAVRLREAGESWVDVSKGSGIPSCSVRSIVARHWQRNGRVGAVAASVGAESADAPCKYGHTGGRIRNGRGRLQKCTECHRIHARAWRSRSKPHIQRYIADWRNKQKTERNAELAALFSPVVEEMKGLFDD